MGARVSKRWAAFDVQSELKGERMCEREKSPSAVQPRPTPQAEALGTTCALNAG